MRWIHTFPKNINTKGNTNSLVQDLNFVCQFHFLVMITTILIMPPVKQKIADIGYISLKIHSNSYHSKDLSLLKLLKKTTLKTTQTLDCIYIHIYIYCIYIYIYIYCIYIYIYIYCIYIYIYIYIYCIYIYIYICNIYIYIYIY